MKKEIKKSKLTFITEEVKTKLPSELWNIYCRLWTLLENKDIVYSGAMFYKVMKIACEIYELMKEELKLKGIKYDSNI